MVIDSISAAYRENAPEYLYFFALYNIFHEFLEDISEDEMPNEATGFKQSKNLGNCCMTSNGTQSWRLSISWRNTTAVFLLTV